MKHRISKYILHGTSRKKHLRPLVSNAPWSSVDWQEWLHSADLTSFLKHVVTKLWMWMSLSSASNSPMNTTKSVCLPTRWTVATSESKYSKSCIEKHTTESFQDEVLPWAVYDDNADVLIRNCNSYMVRSGCIKSPRTTHQENKSTTTTTTKSTVGPYVANYVMARSNDSH